MCSFLEEKTVGLWTTKTKELRKVYIKTIHWLTALFLGCFFFSPSAEAGEKRKHPGNEVDQLRDSQQNSVAQKEQTNAKDLLAERQDSADIVPVMTTELT